MNIRRALTLLAVIALGLLALPALASASGGVEAEKYPATLQIAEGSSNFVLSGAAPYTACSGTTMSGTLTKASPTMGSIAGLKCQVLGEGVQHALNWNGCGIELYPGSENSFDIGPPGCGPVTGLPLAGCGGAQIEIIPQTGRPATYENIVVNGVAEVSVKIQTTLKFNTPGSCKNATLQFEGNYVIGANRYGESDGIHSTDGGFFITGKQSEKESERPRFVGETGGIHLTGGMSTGSLTKFEIPKLGTIQCSSASWSAWWIPLITGIRVSPSISNCSLEGGPAPTIDMRSCSLYYGASNVDYLPPTSYKGAVSIECGTQGDAVEINIGGCVVKIPAQYNPEDSEVVYENKGEDMGRYVRFVSSVANKLSYTYSSGWCILLGKGGSEGSLSIGDSSLHGA